jgi:hypothetical protein|tara:strand:- start:142 stop:954 length:813 start_codon:yes stop_codon:yes gene_type:complete
MAVTYSNNSAAAGLQMAELDRSNVEESVQFQTFDSSVSYNEYEPQEDYKFTPVSETDPWYTPDYITVSYTEGGEFYTRRGDDSEPTSPAETYVGPYYTWIKEPMYSDNAKSVYGRQGDNVIGEQYYGINGFGKPKNKGLKPNAILQVLTTIVRTNLKGAIMVTAESTLPPNVLGKEFTNATKQNAIEQNVFLDQLARPSETFSDAVYVKNTGDNKYVHITNTVSMQPALEVLQAPNTELTQLGPVAKRFGLKGRAPRITNQPNAKFDFGA